MQNVLRFGVYGLGFRVDRFANGIPPFFLKLFPCSPEQKGRHVAFVVSKHPYLQQPMVLKKEALYVTVWWLCFFYGSAVSREIILTN